MTDFLGNELQVGDKVVCIELDYKNLVRAEVTKLTAKTIFVTYKNRNWEVKRFSDQVVKI